MFTEVQALYGDQMTVFSGGLVYEFNQEPNDFGLIQNNDNGTVTLLGDYNNLMSQYSMIDKSSLTAGNSTGTSLTAPNCDASLITSSSFTTSFDIPDVPSGGQDLINNGISSPNNGKIVTIQSYDAPGTVYNTTGAEITGLRVVPTTSDDGNQPGGNDSGTSNGTPASGTASGTAAGTATSTATGSASSASATGKTSAASSTGLQAFTLLSALVAAMAYIC